MRTFIICLTILFMAHLSFAGHKVHVTAYSENPKHSASGVHLKRGSIAVSQDLLKKGYTFGKRVRLHGIGSFIVADVMPKQWSSRVDVWMPCRSEACAFGITTSTIELE